MPTVANAPVVRVVGNNGADTMSLGEINGALPAARLYGGSGTENDTLGPAPRWWCRALGKAVQGQGLGVRGGRAAVSEN